MNKRLIAKASISINSSVGKVWDALTDPEVIRQYMLGTNVISDWKEKSPIVWKGEWQGKKYEYPGRDSQAGAGAFDPIQPFQSSFGQTGPAGKLPHCHN